MLVSILIPAYNAERFLSLTIKSALQQTWPKKEIIIVDDGSTDHSLALARSFEAGNVKVISQPNSGACVARNRALQESQGDYIQYLDADDCLSSDKIEHQLELFRVYGNEMVASCRWTKFYDDREIGNIQAPDRFLDRNWDDPADWLINSWEGKGMGQTSIWLSPRNMLENAGPWNEQLAVNQDGEYFCRVLLSAKNIRFADQGVVYYRSGNKESITGMISHRKARSELFSYNLCEQALLRKTDTAISRHAIMKRYLNFIYFHYDQYPELVQEAREAIKKLGYNKLESTGGEKFKALSNLVGFENALRMRKVLRKIASR